MTTVSNDLLSTMNPATSNSTGSLNDNSAEAIQNRFLKLLTVQMKNQDPTNPMDNSQLTSQLAQLSTVQGISQLNSTLGTLMSSLAVQQPLQAASMIQRSVLAPGNNVQLTSNTTKAADGTETTTQNAVFGVQLASDSASLKITVRDSTGKAVHQIDLGKQSAGTLPVIWDGTQDDGTKAPNGSYTFDVAATTADGTKVDATPLAFGTVLSVTSGADGVKLNVSNIGTIKVSDVVQIL